MFPRVFSLPARISLTANPIVRLRRRDAAVLRSEDWRTSISRSLAALALVELARNDIQRPRVAPGRERVAQMRKSRQQRSELSRFSDSRYFYVVKKHGFSEYRSQLSVSRQGGEEVQVEVAQPSVRSEQASQGARREFAHSGKWWSRRSRRTW